MIRKCGISLESKKGKITLNVTKTKNSTKVHQNQLELSGTGNRKQKSLCDEKGHEKSRHELKWWVKNLCVERIRNERGQNIKT